MEGEFAVPAELRILKFSIDEVRLIISEFISARGNIIQSYEIEDVQFITLAPDKIEARLALKRAFSGKKEQLAIAPEGLIAAVLFYCVNHRIPMSTKANKRLCLQEGVLSLVMSLAIPRNEAKPAAVVA